MKLIKPSPGLVEEFKAMARQLPFGELRKMFGYDAVFVNGNMAVGLWQNTCVAKLPPSDREQLLASGRAVPFAPSGGKGMGAWLELSEELAHDPEELAIWSERALRHVATLPPKPAKVSAKKTKKATRSAKKTKKATPTGAHAKKPRARRA